MVSSLGDTLNQGDTLNSTSQLDSAQRRFTLGFYTPEYTNQTYVAIWCRDLDSRPVWIGNRDNPIVHSSNAYMTISSTGNLLVNVGDGEDPILLYAGEVPRQNVSAVLLISGNFVLRHITTDGTVVILWQSFDYPTDTLLPGMKLGVNHMTGRNWTLTSWFGPTNPAPGPFTLEWDFTRNRLLLRRRGVVYWTSGGMRNYTLRNLRVKEFENISPDDSNWNYNFTNVTGITEEYFMYSLIRNPYLTREDRNVISGWMLEYLGYIIDGDRPTLVMADFCYGYNTQGPIIFPGKNFSGCVLREQPECRNQHQTFVLRSGQFIPFNGTFPSRVDDENTNLSLSDCRESCWDDCECAGFSWVTFGCQYWRGTNLMFEQSLDGSSPLIYFLNSESTNEFSNNNTITAAGLRMPVRIIVVVLPIAAVLLILVAAALILVRRSKQRKREDEMIEMLTLEGCTETYEHENWGTKGHDLRLFPYASIIAATSNFSSENKLGEGGFGPVYKGWTPEGHDIAVKLLSRSSGQGLLEFKTELILISKLQHVNLVKLVGFCIHEDDKMIVYDYMPNKSLDFFLFDQSKRDQLDWDRRFNIIDGIAQGLLYLHKYSRLSIVHRDLKCSNILLDGDLNPKISDFGLARIFKQNTDEANTNRRVGTYGYMAPEYAMQGIFSFKSDIYSFGVLVLEILSGRKNSSFHHIEGPMNLVEYTWELWCKDSAVELMDPTLSGSCNVEQLQRCINIGLLCVENRAADRPKIEDVISMLNSETPASLPPPQNPSFITRSNVIEQLGNTTQRRLSTNQLSISEITGR